MAQTDAFGHGDNGGNVDDPEVGQSHGVADHHLLRIVCTIIRIRFFELEKPIKQALLDHNPAWTGRKTLQPEPVGQPQP